MSKIKCTFNAEDLMFLESICICNYTDEQGRANWVLESFEIDVSDEPLALLPVQKEAKPKSFFDLDNTIGAYGIPLENKIALYTNIAIFQDSRGEPLAVKFAYNMLETILKTTNTTQNQRRILINEMHSMPDDCPSAVLPVINAKKLFNAVCPEYYAQWVENKKL